jgi:hypothetical protein
MFHFNNMTSAFSRLFNRRNNQPEPGSSVTGRMYRKINRYIALSFGTFLISQLLFLQVLTGKSGFSNISHMNDHIPNFSSDSLYVTAYPFKPDFGIIFQLMENSNNLFLTNRLINNI